MWIVSRVVGLMCLLWLTWEDVKFHAVSLRKLVFCGMLAVLYQVLWREQKISDVLIGVLIGCIFLFISFVTREALGYGDSMLIGLLGIFLGAKEQVEVLIWAFGAASVMAMILLMKNNFGRKTAFPLIPVFTAGYVVTCVTAYLGK